MKIAKIFKSHWWLIALLVVAAWLRLYKIPQTLMFSGDQGRDALRVARIWQKADLPLIGPVTSIGNMYLGPLYYYYMLPWLLLSYPSPVGPVYGVAVLSILATALMYVLGKDLVGKSGAIFATLMFALSSVAVSAARFSWNPNPQPLFGLILIWALYQVHKNHQKYWLLVSVCFSILIQLHYMALLTIFPIIFVWFIEFKKSIVMRKQQLKFSFLAILIGLIALIPLIAFDLKHQGVNTLAFLDLMGGKNSITKLEVSSNDIFSRLLAVASETHGRSMFIFFDLHFGINRVLNTLLVVMLIMMTYRLVAKKRPGFGVVIIMSFLLVGLIGTSVYSHNLYPHYIHFLLPATFLFFGWVFSEIWRLGLIGKFGVISVLIWFFVFNISHYPFNDFSPSVMQLDRESNEITQKILPNEKYNVVLLSESKDYYGQNYRYFLNTYVGKEPIDPSFDSVTDVDTLVIINELKLSEAQINDLGIYELEIFKNMPYKTSFVTSDGTPIVIWRKYGLQS